MEPGLSYSYTIRHHFKWMLPLLALFAGTVRAQDITLPPPHTPSTDTKAELSSKETTTTYKLRVNVVQVRVVVRDAKGNLVPGLKREDFQLFDQGKLQAISTFGIETAQSRRARVETATIAQPGESVKIAPPQRFVALVFDDIHLSLEDAAVIRERAKTLIDSLAPADRLAIYGTSGEVTQEFTSDKATLEKTLLRIMPREKVDKNRALANCTQITYYMGDRYFNKDDQRVLAVVTQEILECMFGGDPHLVTTAAAMAQSELQQALTAGDAETEFTFRALEHIIRRLKEMPGERILVLASPGFLVSLQHSDEMDIVERANRAAVTINTLDARGLYTPNVAGDASQRLSDTGLTAGLKVTYRLAEQQENAIVLEDFAYGTGGSFFHSSNDLAGGLKRAGEAPEVSYVLSFSPQNQRMDGKFHSIKVSLTTKQKYNIQARRGYYAPRKLDDPLTQAKQEIADAVFSQEEIQELPVDLQTQYFISSTNQRLLSVVSHIDVKGVPFRKADGRNLDDLTLATVIFDENGNYVTGSEKVLQMRLLDDTYAKMTQVGLVVKTSFDLKPGRYLIRQVVREAEGAQMAARNQPVFLPF